MLLCLGMMRLLLCFLLRYELVDFELIFDALNLLIKAHILPMAKLQLYNAEFLGTALRLRPRLKVLRVLPYWYTSQFQMRYKFGY